MNDRFTLHPLLSLPFCGTHLQNMLFHAENLILRIRIVCDVDKVLHFWWIQFLILGCNQ